MPTQSDINRAVVISLDKAVSESLAMFEMWRKLGYESKDIFIVIVENLKEPKEVEGLTQIMMRLNNLGLDFTFNIGLIKEPPEEVEKAWADAAHRWNKVLTNEERQKIFMEADCRRLAVDIVAAMTMKGLRPPKNLH